MTCSRKWPPQPDPQSRGSPTRRLRQVSELAQNSASPCTNAEPRLTELAVERRPELAAPEALLEFVRQDAARSQEVLQAARVRPE